MSLIANLDINMRADTTSATKGLSTVTKATQDASKSINASGKGILGSFTSMGSGITASLGSLTAALGPALLGAATAATAGIAIVVAGFAALAAGAAAAVAGLGALAWAQFGNIDALAKTADKIGITTEALASLRHAAEQNGTSVSTMDKGLEKLRINVVKAAQGSKALEESFGLLGLSAKNLASLPVDEQLNIVADALNNVENANLRAKLATDIFGKAGQEMLLTTRIGSEGLAAMADEAEHLGITLSREAAGAVELANDAFDNMKKAIQGVGIQLAPLLAPFVEQLSKIFTEGIVIFRKFIMQFAPHFKQLYNIFSAAWTQIASVIQTAFNYILELAGGPFTDFKTALLEGMIALEYGIANFGQVWEINWTRAKLVAVTFAAEHFRIIEGIAKTILNLPTILWNVVKSMTDAFKVLINNAALAGREFAKALVSGNVEGAVLEKLDAVKGEALAAQKTVGNFLNGKNYISLRDGLFAAEKGLSKDLDSKINAYQEGLDEFTKKRMKELNAAGDKTIKTVVDGFNLDEFAEEIALPDMVIGAGEIEAVTADINAKLEAPRLATFGSQDALDIIAKAQDRGRQEKLLQDQLTEQKKQNELLNKILGKDFELAAANIA